jgi:hypothetical protein
MDVHAGRAVVVGPRNYLSNMYQALPISLTVEGANIMSRNLLIFGQGSMACHPFIRDEFYAVSAEDKEVFRTLIWKHINYFMNNLAKTIVSAWTGGRFIQVPQNPMKRDYQRLSRLSYAYAWLADLSLIVLGGELKRKERLSARLADGMSYLYMAMAALRAVQVNGDDKDEQEHAQWAVDYCFYQAQKSLLALCRNFAFKPLGILARFIAFPFGQTMAYPSDGLDRKLARLMLKNNHYRNRIKQYIYLSGDPQQPLDRMEHALQLIIQTDELVKNNRDLKRLKGVHLIEKLKEKKEKGEISKQELDALLAMEQARWDAILVDEFTFDSLKKKNFNSIINTIKSPLR